MSMLRALSILQPWAWLIVNGHKDIENRTWRMDYRGPLVIHAGKKLSQDQLDDYMHVQHNFPHIKMPPIRDMRGGGIVGTVIVRDCVTVSDSPWFNGPYGFVLSDQKPARFFAINGRLGLFPVASENVVNL